MRRRSTLGAMGVAMLSLMFLAATVTACTISDLVDLSSQVLLPSIDPVADAPAVPDVVLSWPFEGGTVTISVPIDAAVLAGASASTKSAIVFDDAASNEWLPGYYRAFIDAEEQGPLYEHLLGQLRSTRDSLGLDSDRYAELIFALAQSLEYHTDPGEPEPQFPIETVADAAGDCDDKTLLAAALLAREGYGVALLSFEAENHMTLGIRSDGPPYGGTGYTLVEMTRPSLAGWVPDDVGDDGPLTSEPLVIAIGEGTTVYGAAADTAALESLFRSSVARAEELGDRLEASQATIDGLTAELASRRAELDRLAAAGRYTEHNALVPSFNTLVGELDALVETHNALVAERNTAAERVQLILAGQTDRYGLVHLLGERG